MVDLDAMIEPLRTPLVLGLAMGASVFPGVATVVLQFVVWKSAKDFFASLGPDDPKLDPASFTWAPTGTRLSGPMNRAQLAYFKAGHHARVRDAGLEALGHKVQSLANLHAVTLVGFLLSVFATLALRYKG